MKAGKPTKAKVEEWRLEMEELCEKMADILAEVVRFYPEANLFLDGSMNLNVMKKGPSGMDGYDHNQVLFSVFLNADGGDW